MKQWAIISKNRMGHRLYRKLLGWTLDPMKAALSEDKPSVSVEHVGLAVQVRNLKDLAKQYPAGDIYRQ